MAAGSATCRTRIVGTPFNIAQTTSGKGCISTHDSQVSLTAATNVYLDPYSIGGRLFAMAALFEEYMIHRGTLTYIPQSNLAGIVDSPAGPGLGPGVVASRFFAMAVLDDPGFSATNTDTIVQSGGRWSNSSRMFRLPLPRSVLNKWRFSGTSVSYGTPPTVPDIRQAAFGILCAQFSATSSTASGTLGVLVLDIDVTFRGPTEGTTIGFAKQLSGYIERTTGEDRAKLQVAAGILRRHFHAPRQLQHEALSGIGSTASADGPGFAEQDEKTPSSPEVVLLSPSDLVENLEGGYIPRVAVLHPEQKQNGQVPRPATKGLGLKTKTG